MPELSKEGKEAIERFKKSFYEWENFYRGILPMKGYNQQESEQIFVGRVTERDKIIKKMKEHFENMIKETTF